MAELFLITNLYVPFCPIEIELGPSTFTEIGGVLRTTGTITIFVKMALEPGTPYSSLRVISLDSASAP